MPIELDVRSISVVAFVVYVALAVIMLHERFTRRVYPGFTAWTVSQVMLAAGMVLVSLRGLVPEFIPVLFGSALLLFAQTLIYDGLVSFFGDRPRRGFHYTLFATVMAADSWFLFVDDRIATRTLLFSGFTVILLGHAVVSLLTNPRARREPAARLIAGACLLMAAFSAVRGAVGLDMPAGDLFHVDPLLSTSFLISTVVSIVLVFGFVQLVQSRMEAELQAAQGRAEALANTDGLTGVWNRRRFETEAAREMARAGRHGQPLSLILLDIDHFKEINDRHGHQAGDTVLTTLCDLVCARIRGADSLTRWGGDEFLVLAPMTTAAEATQLAEALRAEMAAYDFGAIGPVTLSVGVAQYRPPAGLEQWMAEADQGLYAAKALGRDRVMLGMCSDVA